MNAWSMFAIVPLVLMLFYWSLPQLSEMATGEKVVPVDIAKVDLPTAVIPAPVRIEKINYAAFGMNPNKELKVVVKKVVKKKVHFYLESILMSDTGQVAVINGNIVRKGAKLAGGYRIAEIKEDEVLLQRKGSKRILRFPKYVDKQMRIPHAKAHKVQSNATNRKASQNSMHGIPSMPYNEILKQMKL